MTDSPETALPNPYIELARVDNWFEVALDLNRGFEDFLAAEPRGLSGLGEVEDRHNASLAIANYFEAGRIRAVSEGIIDESDTISDQMAVDFLIELSHEGWGGRTLFEPSDSSEETLAHVFNTAKADVLYLDAHRDTLEELGYANDVSDARRELELSEARIEEARAQATAITAEAEAILAKARDEAAQLLVRAHRGRYSAHEALQDALRDQEEYRRKTGKAES